MCCDRLCHVLQRRRVELNFIDPNANVHRPPNSPPSLPPTPLPPASRIVPQCSKPSTRLHRSPSQAGVEHRWRRSVSEVGGRCVSEEFGYDEVGGGLSCFYLSRGVVLMFPMFVIIGIG